MERRVFDEEAASCKGKYRYFIPNPTQINEKEMDFMLLSPENLRPLINNGLHFSSPADAEEEICSPRSASGPSALLELP
jgi:hypothetical protein